MKQRSKQFDPTTLEIYRALFTSVTEEMGVALRRTAFSPNIKERRDYSCALFDSAGRVIAQGDHMPVHLGSMPMAVAAALRAVKLEPGDVVALNDPYAGGTHLPDVTLVMAVYGGGSSEFGGRVRKISSRQPLFFVANRAHHADIGGASPGSMGVSSDIYGEGVRIPPLKIVRHGEIAEDLMSLLLANLRGQYERRGDFAAQIGSLRTGEMRLLEIVEKRGARQTTEYAQHLIDYSSRIMQSAIRQIPDGTYEAEDYLDDDGIATDDIAIRLRMVIKGKHATVDFTDSSPQVAGPVNAVEAITVSAVSYVFRCLVGDVPASAGLLDPIKVIAPPGTIVNAIHPAPVAGGNVETSQRIVDVLFKALSQAIPNRIPAASQGTMNNLTIGGIDVRTGEEFSYYETIAGGMGARPSLDGLSAIHTHMTNSLNTPIEALEYAYPLRVRSYKIRKGSGGEGKHRGGDGVVREIESLVTARMSLLSERRKNAPYGLHGGENGAKGVDVIIRNSNPQPDPAESARHERIASKGSWLLSPGDVVHIETPGGGGHGSQRHR